MEIIKQRILRKLIGVSVLASVVVVTVNASGLSRMTYEQQSSNLSPVTTKYHQTDHSIYSTNYHYPTDGENNYGGGRQISSLAATNLQSPAGLDYIYGATAGDNYAAGGGHGHSSSSSHGQGGGHGHGHGGGYGWGKTDCNSALGLLGVLGLASYLQNVLRQMTTARPVVAVPGVPVPGVPGRENRYKRAARKESKYTANETEMELREMHSITKRMLPLLTAVGHARDGLIPVECTRRQVCLVNKLLLKELGVVGKSIGIELSSVIGRMLKEVNNNELVIKNIEKAAMSGSLGLDCEQLYSSCPALSNLPVYTVPPALYLLEPV